VNQSEGSALRLERAFSATPEEVFDAWTNPEVLARWCAPGPTSTSPGCDVDLRVGGRYVLRMHDGESGEVHVVGGEYREIERPRRLVYTWCWQGANARRPGHVSLVTVEFVARGGSTAVVLEHTGLPSEESGASHTAGWRATLEKLAVRVFHETDKT
jgi:uncharacterized protein YndB with AHSA1/START domain